MSPPRPEAKRTKTEKNQRHDDRHRNDHDRRFIPTSVGINTRRFIGDDDGGTFQRTQVEGIWCQGVFVDKGEGDVEGGEWGGSGGEDVVVDLPGEEALGGGPVHGCEACAVGVAGLEGDGDVGGLEVVC